MKFSFKFSNIFGAVYKKGNLVFTGDGNTLISPVGNRISLFDLKNNKSCSLPVESYFNFTTSAVSPDGTTLIAVNEEGDAHLISLISRSLIHRYNFKHSVSCVKFSPDGKYVAVAKGRAVHVFRSPGKYLGEYNPFVLEKVFLGPYDDVTCLDWTSDSAQIICGSRDTTARIYSMKKSKKFRICTFSGHGDVLVGVFFEENSLNAVTISANARIDLWEANMPLSGLVDVRYEPPVTKKRCEDDELDDEVDLMRGELRETQLEEEGEKSEEDEPNESLKKEKLRYRLNVKKQLKKDSAKITTAAYHKSTRILVVGRDDGAFLLYELPEVNMIHSLSIANTSISSITFNNTGDWLAMGCENHGQLLVWEWQSESYILKQQGHSSAISCLEYSGNGQYIATGGEDGKVKLWNTLTGFCFVTFKDHSSCVTAVRFARNGKFVVSASVDGTVRAFDLMRYRNFRTLTTPRPVQFSSLAIDSSSEFVAAGGQDVFEVYLWSLKVGRLLEVMAGHEGPVISVDFNPGLASTELVSASWDKSIRVWNAIDSSMTNEAIQLGSDCLAVTYRPDGKEFAVATLDGQISFFDPVTARQTGYIDGKNDLASGRSDTDLITAKKTQQGKAFTSLCYSADGDFIIAGGQSKYVCIYSRKEEIIVKRYEVTQNRSLDAIDDFINRRKMTEFGNINLVEMRDDGTNKIRLPGAKKTDMAARSFKPEIRVFSIQFSPTNHAWAVASTEGLLIYSLDAGTLFDPYLLDESITPNSIRAAKKQKKYSSAIMMSLRLNEKPLIKEVVEYVPPAEIEIVSTNLPETYVEKLLDFIASVMDNSKFIEFYLIWVKHLLVRTKSPPLNVLLALQKSVHRKYQDLSKLANFNKYSIMLIRKMGALNQVADTEEDVEMTM